MAGVALARANVRYWPTVAPLTGRELRRWEARAREIPDPAPARLALVKAPRGAFQRAGRNHARDAAARTGASRTPCRALVALEVAYDYLDGLTELPAEDPLARGALPVRLLHRRAGRSCAPRRLLAVAHRLTKASTMTGATSTRCRRRSAASSLRFSRAGRSSLPSPSRGSSAPRRHSRASTRRRRCGDAQLQSGPRHWPARPASDWREFLAGAAASVLACHALIVAAADPTHDDGGRRASGRFLPAPLRAEHPARRRSIDRRQRPRRGRGFDAALLPEHQELADALCSLARDAAPGRWPCHDGPHHLMIMVGVVAYYISAPEARDLFARRSRAAARAASSRR